MSGVFAALGCKRITVLSGNHLRSQNNFHVFCVAGVIVHIYLVLGDHRMSIFSSCRELRYFVFGFVRCFGMRGCLPRYLVTLSCALKTNFMCSVSQA